MPTQDQVRQMVAEFEREYPESLSDRLKWWARVLGIDRIRLFRLLGLSRAEAARTPLTALPQVVASHEDRAEMVDEMLGQLLASFDYDLPAFRTAAHRPVGPASTEKRRARAGPVSSFRSLTPLVRRCGVESCSTRSLQAGRPPCPHC